MFHVTRAFTNFSGRGHQISHFFKRSFFTAANFKRLKWQKTTVGGSGGMLPRKMFENLHTVIAILVLFEQFSGKVCSYFSSLTLSASPNMMHFVCTVSIMRA